jgi:hypothetical protein
MQLFYITTFYLCLVVRARLFIKASSERNRINVLAIVNALTKEVITFSNTTYITAENYFRMRLCELRADRL